MRTLALAAAAVFTLGCIADNPTVRAPRSPLSPASATDDEAEGPSIPVRPLPPGAYNLGQLPVLSKVLYYLRQNYFDRSRFNYRGMALGALEFVQRDVPEVVVERLGRDQDQPRGFARDAVSGGRAGDPRNEPDSSLRAPVSRCDVDADGRGPESTYRGLRPVR